MEKKKKIIITLIITMIIVGITLIKFGNDIEKNQEPIYSYTAEKSDEYEVLLKPNTFYDTERLPSGGYYVAKSIKEYIINLNYKLKGSKKTRIEYNYNIVGNLIGTVKESDNENKEVWNKSFILLDTKNNKQEETDEININEQVNIDYDYYNDLANAYEKNYEILINAILKLRININYTINMEEFEIETGEDYIELEIPITNTISEVRENYQNTTQKEIKEEENTNFQKIIFYTIGVLFIISAILIIVIKLKKDENKHNLKHILNYYKDIIVKVNNVPDLKDMKIMELSNIEDLIDVAEQTQNNIINKGKNFYVIVNNFAYTFTIEKTKNGE